jgi:hypothetical protein
MGSNWVNEEMHNLQLKDKRLVERTKKLLAAISQEPAKSIPEACGNWAGTKAAYRYFSNESVESDRILETHYQKTQERAQGKMRVLAIQDTTELNYSGKEVAAELGHLANAHSQGLLMHSVLLASVAGMPLGLLDQHVWKRDENTKGKAKDRRKKPTSEKESQRWLDAMQVVEERLPEEVEVIHVADREADIYDLLALKHRPNSQVVIRVDHNRRVEHTMRSLWGAMRQAPIAGEILLELRPQPNREARLATLRVRFQTLTVCPPHKQTGEGVRLQFILAEEQDAPPGVKPIVWLLATSLPVSNFEEALTCLRFYALRWLIERFHFVLKSGCLIEQLYLQTENRLRRALAIYSIVAWRLLWLTYEARMHPDQPCSVILQTHEWQALYCTIHKTPMPPEQPPSLQEAVIWIARLGGFLARKGDGFPGPKTIWQGLRRLDDIADTWLLVHSHHP